MSKLSNVSNSGMCHGLVCMRWPIFIYNRCGGLQTEHDVVIKSISNIQEELKQCTEREKSALALNQKLAEDKLICEERVKMFQGQTANASQEANGHKERHASSNLVFLIWTMTAIIRLQQMEIRLKVLQERFADQATTLKLAKEANGDAQVSHPSSSLAQRPFHVLLSGETFFGWEELYRKIFVSNLDWWHLLTDSRAPSNSPARLNVRSPSSANETTFYKRCSTTPSKKRNVFKNCSPMSRQNMKGAWRRFERKLFLMFRTPKRWLFRRSNVSLKLIRTQTTLVLALFQSLVNWICWRRSPRMLCKSLP